MRKLNKKVKSDFVTVGANAKCYACVINQCLGSVSYKTQKGWQKDFMVNFTNGG